MIKKNVLLNSLPSLFLSPSLLISFISSFKQQYNRNKLSMVHLAVKVSYGGGGLGKSYEGKKTCLGGSGGMLPMKTFGILGVSDCVSGPL